LDKKLSVSEENDQDEINVEQDEVNESSTMGTMIINYETINENVDLNEKEPEDLKKLVLKEAKEYMTKKHLLRSNLSKEDIELRLRILDSEIEARMQQLKDKYAKNKENILKG
jgi:hypothetical protein